MRSRPRDFLLLELFPISEVLWTSYYVFAFKNFFYSLELSQDNEQNMEFLLGFFNVQIQGKEKRHLKVF